MMFFDTHMHADFSCDSHMKLTDAIAACERQGIGMVLTEHWDTDYPTNPGSFQFDIPQYFQQNGPYRSDKVLLGIEVGMQPHAADGDNKMIAAYPFDEVIASQHCVLGWDIYEQGYYAGKSKEQALEELLLDSIKCLELYHDFDTLGHIDYMCRYMPYEDKHPYYKLHSKLWDELFGMLIGADKAIEINTRRLDDPKAVEVLQEHYNRFHALGGKYVTIGSDAHYAEHVGRGMATALRMAREAGLKVVYFRQRQRMLC